MTSQIKRLRELAQKARSTHTYRADRASLIFTEELFRHMKEQEVTKSELARRIGTSPAYVTKILRGETNFTLDTMVKIAHALNCRLQTHLARQGFRTHWLDEAESETRVFVTKEVPELNATDFADVDASFSAAA